MADVFSPTGETLCCGFEQDENGYELTRGVKIPRLTGLEWQQGLLHTGAVRSLEQLFCLEARPVDTGLSQGAQGHADLCDDFVDDEKRSLVAYLRSL